MACSYGKILIPPTYDLGKFKRDLGKRASSLSHMNAMKILIGKQLRGEIIGRRNVGSYEQALSSPTLKPKKVLNTLII